MYYQPKIQNRRAYPLPPDYFPPVSVTRERLQELREEADTALQRAVTCLNEYGADRLNYLRHDKLWRLHSEYEGLKEYKRPHKTLPTGSYSHIFGRIEGHYRDILGFYRSETTERYFEVQKRLFHYTIDARVLYNVPPEELLSASPCSYEGIKWVAYEPFSLRFKTDSLHYEATGTVTDSNGITIGYRILVPIALPEVPDLFRAKRTVRMHAKSVMLLLPSRSCANTSELFLTMENDFKYNQVPRSFYKRYMMSLHRISAFVDQRRIATSSSINADDWAPVPDRPDCGVCARPFSLFRSKHNCHVCGDLVCRKCLVATADVVPQSPHQPGAVPGPRPKLCTPCMRMIREDQLHALTTPMNATASGHSPWMNRLSSFCGGGRSSRGSSFCGSETLRYSETPTETSSNGLSASSMSIFNSSRLLIHEDEELYDLDEHHAQPRSLSPPQYSPCYSSYSIGSSVASSAFSVDEVGGGVAMTIDTRDMTPLRYVATNEMFEDLDRSLQEQEALLNQLKLCASAGSRRANSYTPLRHEEPRGIVV